MIEYFYVQHHAKDHNVDYLDIALLRYNSSTLID